MTNVQGNDRIAQMQGSSADQQVRQSQVNTLSRLLTFDPSGKPRNFKGNWIYHKSMEQLFDKGVTALSISFTFRSVDSVCKLRDSNGRKGAFSVGRLLSYPFQYVAHAVAAALPGDQHTRVELIPCGWTQRLTMIIDDLLKVRGEFWIEGWSVAQVLCVDLS